MSDWVRSAAAALSTGLAALLVAACSSTPPRSGSDRDDSRRRADPTRPAARAQAGAPAVPLPTNPRGGYYGDDGPPDLVPPDLASTPDAVPRAEPLLARANRPYVVFGRSYVPMAQHQTYRERGSASWYGRKFHGQATSSGEIYDMFGMTAAHPTLPIPSYVRVTHLRNARSVVVRVNDRGPFLNNRLIDLSYAAAVKLGYAQGGSAEVEVELIVPDDAPSWQIMQASAEGGLALQPAVSPAPLASPPLRASPAPSMPGPRRARSALDPTRAASPPEAALAEAPMGSEDGPVRLIVETLPAAGAAADAPAGATRPATTPPGATPLAAALPAATPPVPPPPVATTPAAASSAGTFLQLGAFSSRPNADAARNRIAASIDLAGAPVDVIEDRGLFKVQAGPLTTRDAAALAERIRQATGSRPFSLTR